MAAALTYLRVAFLRYTPVVELDAQKELVLMPDLAAAASSRNARIIDKHE